MLRARFFGQSALSFATGISLPAAVTFALLAGSGIARADVAPEDVWRHWQTMAVNAGYALNTGAQTRSGATLELRDVTMMLDQDGLRAHVPIGTILFRDRGDGSVDVVMPASYPVELRIDEEESVEMVLRIAQPGLAMIASGDPEALRYDYSAENMTIALESISVDGTAVAMQLTFALDAPKGSLGTSGPDAARQQADIAATGLRVSVDATDPESGGTVVFDFDARDLAAKFGGTLTPGMAGVDVEAALDAGFAFDMDYSLGATRLTLDMTDDSSETSVAAAMDGSSLLIALDAERLRYADSMRGLSLAITGSEIPMPEVAMNIAEYAMSVLLPVRQSAEPEDFSVGLRLVGLTLNDGIWGMFDPMGALARDPATLVVDLRGKLRMLENLVADAPEDADFPGELHALSIEALQVSAAGAELTGTGAMTFDNSDLQTFDGMPRPTGAIDLQLTGGNGLIDRLVSMGLVPADQAMAARMMMGMFARPGGGPDTLTSRIEVTPDGAVLANGQRIQ